MELKEFLENTNIDDEWRVQYFTKINNIYDTVILFDTAKENSITEEELIQRYGNRCVESIFIDTVRNKYHSEYPQIVIEIEED